MLVWSQALYQRQVRQIRFGGLEGPPPRDLVVLLIILFATYSAQFFLSGLGLFRLSEAVWQRGFVWQVITYPWIGLASGGLIGVPRPSIFILLELFILYLFAQDVFSLLGRRRFWRMLLIAPLVAAGVALLIDGLAWAFSGSGSPSAFALMQGQRMIILVVIAAFATLRSEATILLFFVLPIKARWFLWLEVAFAFIGFLGTKDYAGFLGVCAAIAATVWLIRFPTLGKGLRELRLRTERRILERRLRKTRRKSKLRIVKGEAEGRNDIDHEGGGPWVH